MAYPRYLGDLDNDGYLTIKDVSALINVLLGKTTDYDSVVADVNQDGLVTVSDISQLISIVLGNAEPTEYIEGDYVSVVYDGSSASVTVPTKFKLVSYSIDGGHVSITNTDVSQEIPFDLSGSTTDGSFTYTGSYKTTLILDGVDISNPNGGAIDIQCGKRIAIELAEGTTNSLSDCSSGSQKAALYCKGHIEFSKGGSLTVVGNSKHGISSKEYILLKKTLGSLTVSSAVSDGIHAGQYFKMNGGDVIVSNVGGDAIQSEGTNDTSDENNGQLLINGGSLDLSVSTDDCDGLKSDSLLIISDGSVTITTTGASDKGIKSKYSDVFIYGGEIDITQSGEKIVSADDISYSTGIKSGCDVILSGGEIEISNTADGGKGISSDGEIRINEDSTSLSLNIIANGAGGSADLSGSSSGSETSSSYIVYVSLPSSGQGGQGGQNSNYWTNLYLYNSSGDKVATLTSTVTKTTGTTSKTFYYYDFGTSDSGTYYFASDNYTSQRPGSSTTYAIKSGTFTGPTSGEDYYYEITNSKTSSGNSSSGYTYTFTLSNVTNTWNGSTSDSGEDSGTSYNASGLKSDGNITVSGGTVTITNTCSMSKSVKSKGTFTQSGGTMTLHPSGTMQVISSDASYSSGIKCLDYVMTGGETTITAGGTASRGISSGSVTTTGGELTITNSSGGYNGTNDSYTAKGIKSDTDMTLSGGTINISMSGDGGKGIKCSGSYVQGLSGGSGPTLTISTSGSSYGSSSSSGGQWGGMMPGEDSGGSSAKALKVLGVATLKGGSTTITTESDGGEGLESKTAVYIEGGEHYFECYDDCINSSGKIYFNGGVTVCYSDGNDAVDSNAGSSGSITIGDGVIFAYTSKGDPEEGIDCDNNSYISITGSGIAISAGGSQGGGGGPGQQSGSGTTLSNASQGYYFSTSSISYDSNKYYILSNASGTNLVTFSFPTSINSSLSLFTSPGMTKNSTYYIKSSTTAPTDATTSFHGLYLGSSLAGSGSVLSFTSQ